MIPRRGFFEPAVFQTVGRELRSDLQVAVALAYALGWRTQSEMLALELRQVDGHAGTLRLDPGQAKNEQGRLVYMPADLNALITAQVERVRALERACGRIIPYYPLSLPASPRTVSRGPDQGLPQGLAGGVPAREGRADAPARLPPHGGREFGTLGCPRTRGHEATGHGAGR